MNNETLRDAEGENRGLSGGIVLERLRKIMKNLAGIGAEMLTQVLQHMKQNARRNVEHKSRPVHHKKTYIFSKFNHFKLMYDTQKYTDAKAIAFHSVRS